MAGTGEQPSPTSLPAPVVETLLRNGAEARVVRLRLPQGTVIRKEPIGPGRKRRLHQERAALEALAGVPGVVSVHDLHVWSMTAGTPSLSAHVLVDDIANWPVVLHRARRLLKEQFSIAHVTLQPEWLRAAPAPHIPVRPHEGD